MNRPQLPGCRIGALDTIETGRDWHQQHPTWLYRGLLAGTILDYGDHVDDPEPRRVHLHEVGRLALPEGRLGVSDVSLPDEGLPQAVPVGEHPFVVAMAPVAPGHELVIAGLLLTGPGPVVRWSQGLAGDDLGADLEMGDYQGIPFDSGIVAFYAPENSGPPEQLTDLPDRQFRVNGFRGALMKTVSGRPMAVFESGYGDGEYPAWFGHTTDGSVSVVMVDFFLFEDPYPVGDDPYSFEVD